MSKYKTSMSLAKLSKELFKEHIKPSTLDKPFFNKVIEDAQRYAQNQQGSSDDKVFKRMHEVNICILVYETRTDINWKGFINTNFNTELPLATLTNSYLLLFNIDSDVY